MSSDPVWASKAALRRKLRDLPVAQKLKIVEDLAARTTLIKTAKDIPMTEETKRPDMFYWLKTSGSMGHGQSGPYPKAVAERMRDDFRKANPGKAASIELAWEAPFESMIPVKIEENRYGAKGTDIGYVFKVDARWFYVYVNTRCAKKFHRTKDGMFGPGREVFHAHSGGHSHNISAADVAKIEEALKGGDFDTGFKCNIPD